MNRGTGCRICVVYEVDLDRMKAKEGMTHSLMCFQGNQRKKCMCELPVGLSAEDEEQREEGEMKVDP